MRRDYLPVLGKLFTEFPQPTEVRLVPGEVHHLTNEKRVWEIWSIDQWERVIWVLLTNERVPDWRWLGRGSREDSGSRWSAAECWSPHQRTQRRLSPDTSHQCWSSLRSGSSCGQETPFLTNERKVLKLWTNEKRLLFTWSALDDEVVEVSVL